MKTVLIEINTKANYIRIISAKVKKKIEQLNSTFHNIDGTIYQIFSSEENIMDNINNLMIKIVENINKEIDSLIDKKEAILTTCEDYINEHYDDLMKNKEI